MKERSAARIVGLFISLGILLISCDPNRFSGDIRDGNRDIIIDVDDSIFSLSNVSPVWDQGPGVTDIIFTIVMADAASSVDYSIATADRDPVYDFTQVVIPVIGEMVQIDAQAFQGSNLLFSASIDRNTDVSSYSGWEVFANVRKFKLGLQKNTADWSQSYLTLEVAPRGGNAVALIADSGVITPGEEQTDWAGTALATRQLAVQPMLNENPTGLVFDIYTLIVDKNISVLYNPDLTEDAAYEYSPWDDLWSYDEVTSSGKRIGDMTYVLTKYNGDTALPFIEPQGEGVGYNSFLIDLTAETEDPVGKYLIVALVMTYDILSIPTSVSVFEIE